MSSMFTKSRMKGVNGCLPSRKLGVSASRTTKNRLHGFTLGKATKADGMRRVLRNAKQQSRKATGALKQKESTTGSINRIGSHWKRKPPVIEYHDKRQRCNPGTVEGRREYFNRKMEAYQRQQGLCCICLKPLALKDATFEHQNGRNKIDERLWVDGKPLNGCSHLLCNQQRGSRKTKIYHYPQLERTA